MNKFSISQLEHFSGIKAHTIRIWEQRYNALQPERSDGNTRFYNGSQLRRLLNLVILLESGYKISEVGGLPEEEIKLMLEKETIASKPEGKKERLAAQLIGAALTYDEAGFNKIYEACVKQFGIIGAYTNVIYSVLIRVGQLWTVTTLDAAQEHFITNLFRQKLLAAADALPLPKPANHKWLLFLPEDEFHETGLLLANFLLRQIGIQVVYIGANLPLTELETAVADTNPSALLFFLVSKKSEVQDNKYVQALAAKVKGIDIYVACTEQRAKKIKRHKRITWLHSVDDLQRIIDQTKHSN